MKKPITKSLLSNLRVHLRQQIAQRAFTTVSRASHKSPLLAREHRGNYLTNIAIPKQKVASFTTGTMPQGTLIKPPPEDPNKSPIENVLEVTELAVIGPVRIL